MKEAFVTNDDALYERVLTLSNHGRAREQTKQFWPDMVGFKYKMSNIQAAIGCAQVERIESLIRRKREILNRHKELLAPFQGVALNPEPVGIENGARMPTAVFSPELNLSRGTIQRAFSEQGIDAQVFFYPLSSLPMFNFEIDNPVAADIYTRAINSPSYHDITDEQIGRVANVLKGLLSA